MSALDADLRLSFALSLSQTLPTVRSAVTLLIDSELWGFVTPASVDVDSLRAAVAQIQPSYAVPKHYYALDDFPLTSNGKVDKRILRSLAESLGRSSKPVIHHYPSWSPDTSSASSPIALSPSLSEKSVVAVSSFSSVVFSPAAAKSVWWRWLGAGVFCWILWYLIMDSLPPSGV